VPQGHEKDGHEKDFVISGYDHAGWSIEVRAVLTHFFIPISSSLLVYSSFHILSFHTSVIFMVSIVTSDLSSLLCK